MDLKFTFKSVCPWASDLWKWNRQGSWVQSSIRVEVMVLLSLYVRVLLIPILPFLSILKNFKWYMSGKCN